MEPLDPKAELMRLAVNMAGECIESERLYAVHGGYLSDANLRKRQAAEREAKDKLESAITLALAAERRRAVEEAAGICDERRKRRLAIPPKNKECVVSAEAHDCAAAIRALIDGKAGGT